MSEFTDQVEGGKYMTSPASFENEMEYLHWHNYRVLSWSSCLDVKCLSFSWPIPTDLNPSGGDHVAVGDSILLRGQVNACVAVMRFDARIIRQQSNEYEDCYSH